MALVQELDYYLHGTPFSNLACHATNPHIADDPAVFFLLASSAELQEVTPDHEHLASQLIQQLSQELGLKDLKPRVPTPINACVPEP